MHVSTVSRALNPETRAMLSHEVATRVLDIARELSYTRNPLAFGLKTRRSLTIGVVVPDITNPVFPPIIRAIERTLGKEGYLTILADADNSQETAATILDSLIARQVDGLILATAALNDQTAEACRKHQIPFVFVNRTGADSNSASVVTDDAEGIRLAVEHLLDLGHRKLAYVGGPLETSTGVGRRDGFLAALKSYRLSTRDRLIVDCPAFTIGAGADAARELLRTKAGGFTAIVAANDMLALGCCDAIAESGQNCPKDISVTGFNDMPFADRFNPPLTTLRIPHEQLGVRSSQLLLRMMNSPLREAQSVHLEPQLIVRGSSAIVRG